MSVNLTPNDLEILIETLLLAADQPLETKMLARLVDAPIKAVDERIRHLQSRWDGRGIELVSVSSGWRFQTKGIYRSHVEKLNLTRPPRYSRAVMECLAIIAYRQPVTRGDIEQIRGVPVASTTIRTLEERGWIEVIGHRETPGRPELFGTTKQFLDDLNLSALEELPMIELPVTEDLFDTLLPEEKRTSLPVTELNETKMPLE